jgi:hypothetical protein
MVRSKGYYSAILIYEYIPMLRIIFIRNIRMSIRIIRITIFNDSHPL